jgi:hypothetical protein
MTSGRFHYAEEKLKTACRGLAIGEGDVRSRLVSIFDNLDRLKPKEDLPPELTPRLEAILAQMTAQSPLRRPDGTVLRTSVEQTMKGMINRTAARIAKKIVDLHSDLERLHEETA